MPSAFDRLEDQALQVRGTADRDAYPSALLRPVGGGETAPELDRHAADAAVGDDEIRSAAEQEDRQPAAPREADPRGEFVGILDLEEQVRRPADPHRGVP